MGQSSSSPSSSTTAGNNHQRNNYYYRTQSHNPSPPLPLPLPPSPSPSPAPFSPPSSSATPPHPPYQTTPYPSSPPYNFPPQHVRPFAQSNCRYYPPQLAPTPSPRGGRWGSYPTPSTYPSTYHHHHPPLGPASISWASVAPQVPYVEHEEAKTIKNDVNVHKDKIMLEVDEENPDQHLVTFTFDANYDGSITVFYFAKEGTGCTLSPVYPELYKPIKVVFQKGLGQKFSQPSGSGLDLGFFELDDLSSPPEEDVFPLVVYAEACVPLQQVDEQMDQPSTHLQLTEAVIEKKNDGSFQVKVIRQVLWIDGERYELRDIFGLENLTNAKFNEEEDTGKHCVICLSEPRDTAVLPCRHMCMCAECAKALTLQSNKCPMCRQPVEKLIEIKVKSGDS